MTIHNAFVQNQTAYLLSDMAWINPDGTLLDVGAKHIQGGPFPYFIGFSGNANPVAIARRMEKRLPADIHSLAESMAETLYASTHDPENEYELDCGMTAIAYSEDYQTGVILLVDNNGAHFHRKPFEVFDTTLIIPGGQTCDTIFGKPTDPQRADQFDPVQDGITLMEAQRKHERFENYGEPHCRIGGGIMLCTASKDGLAMGQIHEWPDKVGEPIVP